MGERTEGGVAWRGAMAFVPELSYGVTEAASVADACAAPDQAAVRGGETPGQSTRETGQRTNPKLMRQDVGAEGGTRSGAARGVGSKDKAVRVRQGLSDRNESILRVVGHLLSRTLTGEEELRSMMNDFTQQNFVDLTEERSLAGLCGFPLCAEASRSASRGRSLKERLRDPGAVERRFCSRLCASKASAFARSLGTKIHVDADGRASVPVPAAQTNNNDGRAPPPPTRDVTAGLSRLVVGKRVVERTNGVAPRGVPGERGANGSRAHGQGEQIADDAVDRDGWHLTGANLLPKGL